jgi:hypothetical protein
MGELARRAVHETYEIGAMVRAYEVVYTKLLESRFHRPAQGERAPAGPAHAAGRRD